MNAHLLKIIRQTGPTFRNILVNTIGFFPFLLFMSLSDGKSLISVTPFVCFYTCKVLGIFLIREVKNSISSVELLKLALILGLIGSLFAIIGSFLSLFYSISGILIGLSASWLGSANAAFKQLAVEDEGKSSMILMIMSLCLLLISLNFPGDIRVVSTFGLYLFYFGIAYLNMTKTQIKKSGFIQKGSQLQVQETLFSSLDFFIFGGMCFCLFILRMGRLLKDGWDIKLALIGFFFFMFLFLMRMVVQRKRWTIPSYLNVLAFLNGALGNFLFLFGSLYVVNIFGKGLETKLFYLPYALGMIGSLVTYSKLTKKGTVFLLKLVFSLLLMGLWSLLNKNLVIISFTLLSYSHFLLNHLVTDRYFDLKNLPTEQQVLIKGTTQSKGALIHQFSLMGLLIAVTFFYQEPFSFFLRITSPDTIDTQAVTIFTTVKWIVVFLFTIIIAMYWMITMKRLKKSNE